MIKDIFAKMAKKVRSGFARFAPFNVLALVWAVCLVRDNHVAWDDYEAHRLPLSLASGACWGMLASLAARLALERRGCRARLANSVPALCGIAFALVGALFWYHVRAESSWYASWEMLYFGSLVSLGALAAAQLIGKRNTWTVFGQVFLSAMFVVIVALAVWLGLVLCIAAVDELIVDISRDITGDAGFLTWMAMAPIFMAAMLPRDDEPTEQPKALSVLFWFLVPIGALLMLILYVYIAKIVFTWTMPSGKMNWFASFAIGGYLFFWLSLRGSRVRAFAFIARWGWAFLIPVVATQIVGIAIRYNAHGLTTTRMAGMATLAIGIYALALAAFDRSAKRAFVALAIAGMVLTVSPFNIVDVPIRQQASRLRAALERTGCLVDGKLNVPQSPDIPLEDAKVICGSWDYLADCGQPFFDYLRREHDGNAPRLRPGVWHKDEFAQGVVKSAWEKSSRRDLIELLNIDRRKIMQGRRTTTTNQFNLPCRSRTVNISEYKTMETEPSAVLGYENGRYYVSLTENLVTNRYDVTAHVNKLIGNSGAAADYSDGFYHSHDLKEEDALWELTPGIHILVKYITLYHPPEEKEPGHLNCYIFRK